MVDWVRSWNGQLDREIERGTSGGYSLLVLVNTVHMFSPSTE